MSKAIKVGQSYLCKVGRNSVEVKVLNTCDGGWEVVTASGKHLTIKDAARLKAKATAGRDTAQHAAPKAQETPKAKKTGLVDAAILVLRETGQPMNTKEMVDAVLAKGLWKSDGKTPAATLYSSILREIQKKGEAARFTKTERGKFALKS
jgi:hypothetical protein